MTMPWFRFYHEVLDDPKVQRLDAMTFRHWVNILCLAARHDGRLPSNPEMAFALRIDELTLDTVLERLLSAGLIEVRSGGANGSHIAPHGWDKRQFKSDTSTERVKRFRKRSETVTVTATDTDTDTDTDIPPKAPRKRRATIGKPDDVSQVVWDDFLDNRKKKPTETAISRIRNEALKAGWTMEEALAECCARGWEGFKAEWVAKKANGYGTENRQFGGQGDRRSSLTRACDEALDWLDGN